MKLPDLAVFDILKRIGTAESKTAVLKSFDPRLFVMGLAAILGFYLLVFTYVFFSASSTIASLEDHMDSYTLSFEEVGSHDFQVERPNYIIDPETIKSGEHFYEGMGEETSFGILPIIRKEDGLTSFRAYQTPYTLSSHIIEKPAIAFVMKDFGISEETSETTMNLLPNEISLSLSPYAEHPQDWIKKALEQKREVWTFLPVETLSIEQNDTGPLTIMKRANFDKSYKLFHRLIGSNTGSVGIASYSDAIMNQSESALESIISESYGRGLGYLELNPSAPDFLVTMAVKSNAPYIKADMELLYPTGSENSFETLENIARDQGYAVAVVPPYPDIIKHLAIWIEKVGKIDYTIVPASAIYDVDFELSRLDRKTPPSASGTLKKSDMVTPSHDAPHH